jgi:hypothetical protein
MIKNNIKQRSNRSFGAKFLVPGLIVASVESQMYCRFAFIMGA